MFLSDIFFACKIHDLLKLHTYLDFVRIYLICFKIELVFLYLVVDFYYHFIWLYIYAVEFDSDKG